MQQKFSIGFCTFSYGGNGGISSEVPDIREWMVPGVTELSKDPRVEAVRIWNLADTPITMTRNRSVLMAREYGIDFLVMVDSDMKPDMYVGQEGAKKFLQSSFDFLVEHYAKGPAVVGAPYCGPPPNENVYVFRWQNLQSENANPDFQLEMYDRNTAPKLAGIQECAALPTGLIMYDMRAFALTEPKAEGDKPWFYYEYTSKFQEDKASTEDVTMTRDLALVGIQKLGYNPVYCNWDAWAGHWKPKCVGKPMCVQSKDISGKLKQCWEADYDSGVKIVDLKPKSRVLAALKPTPARASDRYVSLTDGTPEKIAALRALMDLAPDGPFVEVGNREGGTLMMAMDHPSSTTVIGIDPYGGIPYTLPNGEMTMEYDNHMRERMRETVTESPNADKLQHFNCTSLLWVTDQLRREFQIGSLLRAAFVFLDGRHDKETVDMELEFFGPRMADGGVLVVDDVSMMPDVDLSGWTRVLDMAYKIF